jgi:Ca2+-binding EF-hand superfamily protein
MILLDADGDGALSLQELQPVLERLFRAMDSDGDGLLTLGEIHAFRPMEQAPSQR